MRGTLLSSSMVLTTNTSENSLCFQLHPTSLVFIISIHYPALNSRMYLQAGSFACFDTLGCTWDTQQHFLRPVSSHCAVVGPAEAATLILNRRLQITETVELSFSSWQELSADASQSRAALLTPGRFIIKTPCPDPHCASLHLCFWLELAGNCRQSLLVFRSALSFFWRRWLLRVH